MDKDGNQREFIYENWDKPIPRIGDAVAYDTFYKIHDIIWNLEDKKILILAGA